MGSEVYGSISVLPLIVFGNQRCRQPLVTRGRVVGQAKITPLQVHKLRITRKTSVDKDSSLCRLAAIGISVA